MLEILPNWHPIFVHFTVALFSAAVGFSVLTLLTRLIRRTPIILLSEFEIVARWCLWLSALLTIATVSFGFYAYYTVGHDATSHVAMTIHRNWAITTATLIYLLACWSFWRYLKGVKLTPSFVIVLLITEGLLLSTAWHGGELVYRYGIGVKSLPQAEEIGHQHHH